VTAKVKKALRQAWAEMGQVAADVTLGGIFGTLSVAARGGPTVSMVDVAYLKRQLSMDVAEVAGPLNREKFGELFAGLGQSERVKVAKLLLLRKTIAAATAPLEAHKAPDVQGPNDVDACRVQEVVFIYPRVPWLW
jgi:hypothetical protein